MVAKVHASVQKTERNQRQLQLQLTPAEQVARNLANRLGETPDASSDDYKSFLQVGFLTRGLSGIINNSLVQFDY